MALGMRSVAGADTTLGDTGDDELKTSRDNCSPTPDLGALQPMITSFPTPDQIVM